MHQTLCAQRRLTVHYSLERAEAPNHAPNIMRAQRQRSSSMGEENQQLPQTRRQRQQLSGERADSSDSS